jgi:uncharacterized protein YecE (DUF72 family)
MAFLEIRLDRTRNAPSPVRFLTYPSCALGEPLAALSAGHRRVALRGSDDLLLALPVHRPSVHQLMASIYIGVSGWRYAPWRGTFYPPSLPHRRELWYASRVFPTIELNGSFYSLQRPEYFAAWHRETPPGFLFAIKGPRFITHVKRLRDIEKPLANFFASGLFNLMDKLGPILWQLPPQMRFDESLIERFLALLPHDTAAALALARKRDHRMKGRARLAIDQPRPLRYAVEVRHSSFIDERFIALLRRHNVALVIADSAKRWPTLHDLTADFVYIRLHGDKRLYQSGYGARTIERWTDHIAAWHAGRQPKGISTVAPRTAIPSQPRDVFCYFDNTDVKLRAPRDAQTLMRKLGCKPLAAHERERTSSERSPQRPTATRSRSGSSRMSANVR